jgi:hypothetical protein
MAEQCVPWLLSCYLPRIMMIQLSRRDYGNVMEGNDVSLRVREIQQQQ